MKKYGKWTILRGVLSPKLGKIGSLMECQCECGTIKIIPISVLKHPNGTKQCFDCMYKYRKKPARAPKTPKPPFVLNPDDKVGNLTVLRKDTLRGHPSYMCKCDCGEIENIYEFKFKKQLVDRCYKCKKKRRTERAHAAHKMWVKDGMPRDEKTGTSPINNYSKDYKRQ